MENIELIIAVGVATFIYRHVEITVWREGRESPFNFEFTLGGNTIRKTKTKAPETVARHARTRVDHELRRRRHKTPAKRKTRLGKTKAGSKS